MNGSASPGDTILVKESGTFEDMRKEGGLEWEERTYNPPVLRPVLVLGGFEGGGFEGGGFEGTRTDFTDWEGAEEE